MNEFRELFKQLMGEDESVSFEELVKEVKIIFE
jgi:hypothetical protein